MKHRRIVIKEIGVVNIVAFSWGIVVRFVEFLQSFLPAVQ
jgi:hypothetical protein